MTIAKTLLKVVLVIGVIGIVVLGALGLAAGLIVRGM
jgi:hypothetical protein